MPYTEVMAMPPRALVARLAALERQHARMSHDSAIMHAKVGEVNWGQGYEGTPPENTANYKVVDTPFLEYLEDLARAAAGLPPVKREALKKKAKRKNLLAGLGLGKKDG